MRAAAGPARQPLWTRDFALTCATTFAFFTALQMQIPVFPSFLRDRIGSSDAFVGLYIGMFTLLGVLMRPFVGRALARRPRRLFMAVGGGIAFVASLLYFASSSLAFLIPLRLFHGLSIAFYYTAASTLVADVAPPERRGEALSYFSMFLYVGLASGPPLGLALRAELGFASVFAVSSALGLACALISLAIREPRAHTLEAAEVERHPLVNRRALFPAVVLVFAAIAYAAALIYTADFVEAVRIPGGGWYFPVLAVSVIVVRVFAGKLADRYGRVVVAWPGLALFGAGIALQGSARSTAVLLTAAAMTGTGFGFFFPSMMAFTVDRVRPVERGSALATFTAAFDLGFGVGGPALGATKGATDYPTMYRVAAASVAVALLLLAFGARRRPPMPETTAA